MHLHEGFIVSGSSGRFTRQEIEIPANPINAIVIINFIPDLLVNDVVNIRFRGYWPELK